MQRPTHLLNDQRDELYFNFGKSVDKSEHDTLKQNQNQNKTLYNTLLFTNKKI